MSSVSIYILEISKDKEETGLSNSELVVYISFPFHFISTVSLRHSEPLRCAPTIAVKAHFLFIVFSGVFPELEQHPAPPETFFYNTLHTVMTKGLFPKAEHGGGHYARFVIHLKEEELCKTKSFFLPTQ